MAAITHTRDRSSEAGNDSDHAEALVDTARVVIVGGGVIGVSVAFHLPEAGVTDVLLLEAQALGSGSLGVPSRLITTGEAAELSPLINTDGLLAAAFSPADGYCTPEAVVLGYATAARAVGARLVVNTPVTGITQGSTDTFEVQTAAQAVRAERFMRRYTRKLWVLDAVALQLPGVEPSARSFVADLVLGSTILNRVAEHFALRTVRALTDHRYMWKVEC